MRRVSGSVTLAVLAVFLGCSEQGIPTYPELTRYGIAGASGCYTVKVTALLTPTGVVSFSGSITGDLEGTVDVLFDEINPFTGVTNTAAANFTWNVSGGIITELVGQSFVTRLENRNVLVPGSTVVKNLGSLRALDGVAKANLTYTGETSLISFETRLHFNGVICP